MYSVDVSILPMFEISGCVHFNQWMCPSLKCNNCLECSKFSRTWYSKILLYVFIEYLTFYSSNTWILRLLKNFWTSTTYFIQRILKIFSPLSVFILQVLSFLQQFSWPNMIVDQWTVKLTRKMGPCGDCEAPNGPLHRKLYEQTVRKLC